MGKRPYQMSRDGRPLVCLWTERGSPRIAITTLPDAGKRTLFNDAHRHIAPDSRVDTDSWRGYNLLGHIYDHHTVKHSECYVLCRRGWHALKHSRNRICRLGLATEAILFYNTNVSVIYP